MKSDRLTPQKLAFGAVSAHLHATGWSGEEIALAHPYQTETHGARSPVCSLVEKYVWTGCYTLQAYFAARAPAEVSCANGSDTYAEPPVDPSFVAHRIPNPASDAGAQESLGRSSWRLFSESDLSPTINLEPGNQADMADKWVKRAPPPNLQRWLAVSGTSSPPRASDAQWIVLSCVSTATEPCSQGDSILRFSSFVVPPDQSLALRREGDRLFTSARRNLADGRAGEVVRCRTYADPFDATWAPWATGSSVTWSLDEGLPARIDIEPATAGLTWEYGRGEANVLLPAEWLRRALDLVGLERRVGDRHREYRFVDRRANVQAVYVETSSGGAHHEALLVQESSLRHALHARERALVWSAWLYRWPNVHLLDHETARPSPFAERNWEWLAYLTSRGLEVQELSPYLGAAEERPPHVPSPVIPVGPVNPGRATKLEVELRTKKPSPTSSGTIR